MACRFTTAYKNHRDNCDTYMRVARLNNQYADLHYYYIPCGASQIFLTDFFNVLLNVKPTSQAIYGLNAMADVSSVEIKWHYSCETKDIRCAHNKTLCSECTLQERPVYLDSPPDCGELFSRTNFPVCEEEKYDDQESECQYEFNVRSLYYKSLMEYRCNYIGRIFWKNRTTGILPKKYRRHVHLDGFDEPVKGFMDFV